MKLVTITMPTGAGKMNRKSPTIPRASTDFCYVVSRDEIESGDVTRFMENFKAERSFSGLNMKQGKTTLLISGYDCCQLELYEIPEVRTYFEKLHQAWPCWSFFCDLRKTTLFWIAACLAQELGIFKTSKHSQIELQFPHAELLKFFEDTLPVAAKLHAKLGIAPGTGIQILWPVSLYLQIAGD